MSEAGCSAGKETCTYGGGKGGGVLPFVAAGLLPAMNGAGCGVGKETCTYGGGKRRLGVVQAATVSATEPMTTPNPPAHDIAPP